MLLKTIVVGYYGVNCYIIGREDSGDVVVIDPGADFSKIKSVLEEYRLKPVAVLNTHGHFDHIGADDEFNLDVYVHLDDKDMLTDPQSNLSVFFGKPFKVSANVKVLRDKEIVSLAGMNFEVLHTPGHTPGGICLKVEDLLFSGDTLFSGSVGRTDFPGASHEQLLNSIKDKILTLPDKIAVYPGHGAATNIKIERKENSFLRAL
jgi:glyoxylase-like metal-dependent hydrolase (beta-lactamase superfamily II)